MNIWVINSFAGTPNSGWGERHFYLGKNWIKMGYNVTIISSTYNHMFKNLPSDEEIYNFENIEGINFCWIRTPRYNPKSVLRFWSMIVFAIRALFVPARPDQRPGVILVSSMPIFPSLSGFLLKRKFKAKRYIFEIRDLWPLTPIHLLGYSRFHPVMLVISWFEKIGYRKSDHIVSLLPNASGYINKISKNPQKFNYIPNGISSELLGTQECGKEIGDQIPKHKFIIGYTGTIGMANALEYLVQAARIMREDTDTHFVLVGDGYLKEDLSNASHGLSNVTFIEKQPKALMQSIISKFDICFIGRNDSPLFDHGVSSNKYFDYMLAAKPILVSSNYIKDPVELSGCGIIVKPESAESIVSGIRQLKSMTVEELNAMGQKGKEYVEKYHNYTYLSQEYEKLFK